LLLDDDDDEDDDGNEGIEYVSALEATLASDNPVY
jgi:hypothetical protein